MDNQEQVEKKTEKTKKYDAVADKVRKLLTATGAGYVKELCEALAEDWYPHLTYDMIQRMEEPRFEIRDKVLNDWTKERNPENGIWKASSIEQNYFPKWLKDQHFTHIEQSNRSKNFERKTE